MDPEVALREIREMTNGLSATHMTIDGVGVHDLVERVQALDEWLSKGGFLPADWRPDMSASVSTLLDISEELLSLARAHRNVIPPSQVVAHACADMHRRLRVVRLGLGPVS